ncbi:MAG: hypothetical protein WDZ54_03465 [Sneathiella sp.]
MTLFLSFSAIGQAADMGMIQLEVTGDPGAAFSGDCRIVSGHKPVKRYRIQGKVPAKYWLPGNAVRCSLEKSSLSSRLRARIIRDEVLEIEQTSVSPFRWLTVTSSGPWGAAKGSATAARPLW